MYMYMYMYMYVYNMCMYIYMYMREFFELGASERCWLQALLVDALRGCRLKLRDHGAIAETETFKNLRRRSDATERVLRKGCYKSPVPWQ